MAASVWARSLVLLPAARLCRCSSVSLAAHALRAGRFSSVRYASAAAVQESREYTTANDASPQAGASSQPRSATPVADEDSVEEQPTFASLEGKLNPNLLRAITKDSFRLTHMTPVQAAVLPLLPELAEPYDPENPPKGPRDLLVKARTGTGKTLGFLIPAVESRLKRIGQHAEIASKELPNPTRSAITRAVEQFARKNVGALIISPTRELATQIANEAIKLTKTLDRFEVRLAVGGLPKRPQLREWNLGRRDILVATPGRLRDFIENEPGFKEGLSTTETFILDEADTLLEMGFREDIQAIAQELKPPPERQTFMFSATVSKGIEQIARATLSKNHIFLNCVPENAAPTHLSIPQYYTAVPSPKDQLPHLLRLIAEDQLANPGHSKVLVFFPTTRMTQMYYSIAKMIGPQVLPAGTNTNFGELHSKKAMNTRVNTSDWFRRYKNGNAVMFTSDVSARGVDYPNVTRVIQVGAPNSGDTYIHRVGRTGRGSNKEGRADLILMPWELGFLTWQMTDIPLMELPVNKLKDDVIALAKKFDENPDESARDRRVKLQRDIAEKLENIDDIISSSLHGRLDDEEIRETVIALLRYYQANAASLRIASGVAVEGVHEWAEALAGKQVDLRIPHDILDQKPFRRRSNSFKRDNDRGYSSSYGDRNDRSRSYSRRDDGDGSSGYRSFQRRDNNFGGEREGGYRSFQRRDNDSGGEREGGYRSFQRRDNDSGGERRSFQRRDNDDGGERRSFQRRDSGEGEGGYRSFSRRDDSDSAGGERTPSVRRNRWEGRGSSKTRSARFSNDRN